MPLSSRGVKYYGNIHGLLNCTEDHDKIANVLYEKLAKEGGRQTRVNCNECGSLILVFKRESGDWETRIFPSRSIKEK